MIVGWRLVHFFWEYTMEWCIYPRGQLPTHTPTLRAATVERLDQETQRARHGKAWLGATARNPLAPCPWWWHVKSPLCWRPRRSCVSRWTENQDDGSPHVSSVSCQTRSRRPPLQQIGVWLREPLLLAPTSKSPSPDLPRNHASQ
jgi:hypothetical protein